MSLCARGTASSKNNIKMRVEGRQASAEYEQETVLAERIGKYSVDGTVLRFGLHEALRVREHNSAAQVQGQP